MEFSINKNVGILSTQVWVVNPILASILSLFFTGEAATKWSKNLVNRAKITILGVGSAHMGKNPKLSRSFVLKASLNHWRGFTRFDYFVRFIEYST